MNQNLYCTLRSQFPSDRSACALETWSGDFYTWADLDAASAKIANLFKRLKLQPGERVVVQVNKSPEAVLLYLGVIRAGLVFVPLNSAYQANEVSYFVANARPKVLVVDPDQAHWAEPIARAAGADHFLTLSDQRSGTLIDRASHESSRHSVVRRSGSDLAAILYTSGTTGRSKGAMLSHHNLLSNAQVLKQYWGWKRSDVLLHALPIFHVHGLFVALHGALISGSKMLWFNQFDRDAVVQWLPRATVFMGVPTMYVRLLDCPAFDRKQARNIRLFVSGSAPLSPDTFEQFEARTGKRILERYGMSETLMLTSNPYQGERIGGTVGLPLPGLELRIADSDQAGIGEIEVKGLSVFSGYWDMPEKNAEDFTSDGYFKTGDVGQLDARGYLKIVGRAKDLIITGGYNVYPKEIESVLDAIDGVQESAVIGVPHRDFGEAVTAVVVPKPGYELDEAALIALLKTKIANFKVPKRIYWVRELPRNSMGKVQKNLLRATYSAAN